MKRLSKSFLRVGGIIDIVIAASMFITVIVFAILASPVFTDALVKGFENGTAHTAAPGTPEEQAFAVQIVFLGLAVGFSFIVVGAIIASIFSFKAVKNYNKGMLIANIVLGFACGSKFSAAAGILGTIALARENRNASRQEVVDAIEEK